MLTVDGHRYEAMQLQGPLCQARMAVIETEWIAVHVLVPNGTEPEVEIVRE